MTYFNTIIKPSLGVSTTPASLPSGYLGLGKRWAPGSGLLRCRGWRRVWCLAVGRRPGSRSFDGGASSLSWGRAPFPVVALGLRKTWALGRVLD